MTTLRSAVSWLAPLFLCACGDSTPSVHIDSGVVADGGSDAAPPVDSGGGTVDVATSPDAPPAKPHLQYCTGRSFVPTAATGTWNSTANQIAAALGSAGHSAQDAIVTPAATKAVNAVFTYSTFSYAIDGETVLVFLDDCGVGWHDLGSFTTDSNGRVSVPVTESLPVGVYEMRFEVAADATMTYAYLWVLPAGSHIAVADIDGTLTTSDTEMALQSFSDLYSGAYVASSYPGAVDLTTAEVGRGHVLLYLTARPYWLANMTRAWLSTQAYAFGPLHTTDNNTDATTNVAPYKQAYLQGLVDAGFLLDLGYGNATTDIDAYTGVGIPATQIWIIGSNGGTGGTNAVTDTWADVAAAVAASPAVVQPFLW